MAKRGSIVENMRVSKAGAPARAVSRTSDEGWASTSVHRAGLAENEHPGQCPR